MQLQARVIQTELDFVFWCRIVRAFVEMFGIKLNKFKMVDPNTFYFVNGVRRRTSAVQRNPDVLQYQVWRRERGQSAEELKEQALQAVNHTGNSHFGQTPNAVCHRRRRASATQRSRVTLTLDREQVPL